MPSGFLPREGTHSLADFAKALPSAPSALGTADVANLRLVAFVSAEQVFLYSGVLVIGEPDPVESQLLDLGSDVYLVSEALRASALGSAESIQEQLEGWRRRIRPDAAMFGFNSQVNLRRDAAQSTTVGIPAWVTQLRENTTATATGPWGELANTARSFFARSIDHAAAKWLKEPARRGRGTSASHSLDILVLDPRAYFVEGAIKRGMLCVEVRSNVELPLHCAAEFQVNTERFGETHLEVREPRVSLAVPKRATLYEIQLWGSDNFCYDVRQGVIGRGTSRQSAVRKLRSAGGLLVPASHQLLAEVAPARERVRASSGPNLVAPKRLRELRRLQRSRSSKHDLTRLIRVCEELNSCYAAGNYLAVAALVRMLLDHIPPAFGAKTLAEVSATIPDGEGRSVKKIMKRLNESAREIANRQLHLRMGARESLPDRNQIEWAQEIDAVLDEIVRRA